MVVWYMGLVPRAGPLHPPHMTVMEQVAYDFSGSQSDRESCPSHVEEGTELVSFTQVIKEGLTELSASPTMSSLVAIKTLIYFFKFTYLRERANKYGGWEGRRERERENLKQNPC